MKKFFGEFKKFISKGNVMDLAVAFIIGAAFKAIITSLVSDVIMPIVSLVVGPQGFENYKYVITEADEATGVLENAIYYGNFIQSVIDFFIVAFVVFLMVRTINRVKDALEKDVAPEPEIIAEPKPTVEELLTDIKTLLAEQQK
jgi:large conductance mechanosensitive channel